MPSYPSSRLWCILFLNFYYDSHWGFAKSLRSDLNCGLKSFLAILTLSHYPIFCLTDHSVFVATMSLVHSSVWTCRLCNIIVFYLVVVPVNLFPWTKVSGLILPCISRVCHSSWHIANTLLLHKCIDYLKWSCLVISDSLWPHGL